MTRQRHFMYWRCTLRLVFKKYILVRLSITSLNRMFVSVYKTNISVKAVHMKEFWFKHKLGKEIGPQTQIKEKKSDSL